jgi:hypothetical protein
VISGFGGAYGFCFGFRGGLWWGVPCVAGWLHFTRACWWLVGSTHVCNTTMDLPQHIHHTR